MIYTLQEQVKIPSHIEQANRFCMQSQLRPGNNLKELIEGAETAGHCDKGARKFRHHSLSLVHARYEVEFRQTIMGKLFGREGVRDHTDDFSLFFQNSVRNDRHQTNAASAVDEPNSL